MSQRPSPRIPSRTAIKAAQRRRQATAWSRATVHTFRAPIGWHWVLHHDFRDLTHGWSLTQGSARFIAEGIRRRHVHRLTVPLPDRVRARVRAILHPRRTRSERIIAAALADL